VPCDDHPVAVGKGQGIVVGILAFGQGIVEPVQAEAGDQYAFERLVQAYDQGVLRLAFNLLRSSEDASDVYQEAFLRVYKNLHTFRFDCSFHTWLYRIVTNVALSTVTRRREHATGDPLEPVGPDLDPAGTVQTRERLGAVLAALRELTPEQRACYVLREVEGLTYDELAEVFGTSVQAVKSRLFRARTELARALARYDASGEEADR
jgi:RNA polymerase sigma-70 factor (ECF subfamily)